MKRFRVRTNDFDTRARYLNMQIEDHWEDHIKAGHENNKAAIREGLREEYGSWDFDRKLQDFLDIGPKPFSVLAFHNRFSDQIRRAFIAGAYYPALIGACALGERILNHLVRLLRDDFKASDDYKRVYRKDSFDNWQLPISVLTSWGVLLPATRAAFADLNELRNRSVHFDPATDTNDRALALKALELLTRIIESQFGSFGPQPWFIADTRSVAFLTKDAESLPFIMRVYIPNANQVGPWHEIQRRETGELVVIDTYPYQSRDISDEEFRELYHSGPPKSGAVA